MYGVSKLFTTVCNISTTAIFVIFLVILIRQFLKKSYKSFSYYLWSLVGFRLICPISFSSNFSLFNIPLLKNLSVSGNTIEWRGMPDYKNSDFYVWQGNKTTGAEPVVRKEILGGAETDVIYEAEPLLILKKLDILAFLWLTVCLLFLGYQLYTYFKLKKKLQMAVIGRKHLRM